MSAYRIAEARKKKGWNQKQLADALNTTQQVISRYENGEREPRTSTLMKISEVTGMTLSYVLGMDIGKEVVAAVPSKSHMIPIVGRIAAGEVREAHGLPPIDDAEARARVAEIIDKMDDRDPSPAGATVRDAMDELGVSKQTVHRMIKDGRLVASKSRGRIVIDAPSLAAMAKNGQVRRARTARRAR